MSGSLENDEMDFGANDEFADVDLGIGASIPDTKPPISSLEFMDLYVRIDQGAGSDTESRYQTEDSAAMLIVPEKYNSDINAMRDELRRLDSEGEGIPKKGFRFYHGGVRYRGGKTRTISSNPQIEFEDVVCFRRFKSETPDLDNLSGWAPYNRNYLKYLMGTSGGGIIIIAGGTGDGKTTTGIGLLTYASRSYPGLTFMIEDPCEYILNGPDKNAPDRSVYMQHEVVKESDWADLMKIGLRFHPRTFYVGEVRDADTAAQALLAGVTGHLVILTLHGFSCSGAISALIQRASSIMGAAMARDLLADGLLATVHQTRNARQEDGSVRKFQMSILEGGSRTGAVREHIRKMNTKMLDAEISNQNNLRRNQFASSASATKGPSLRNAGDSPRPRGEVSRSSEKKQGGGFFGFGRGG